MDNFPERMAVHRDMESGQRYSLEDLAHMVLQTRWVRPCMLPLLTLQQRRAMAEEADRCGEGMYQADALMKESDRELANIYISAMWDYVRDQMGECC